MTTSNRISASPAVIVQTIDNEMVFFHTTRGAYFTLDTIGARTYTLLIELGIPATIDRLLEEFDGDRATIAADVSQLVDSMLKAGILELGPE